ncbi:MarR family winged helix-turn-helix transcriptional regulator [Sulfobacillus sp. hq2]|nr:MarR family transcriptional regulator [Sulfobacillus sp. hq2]MCY0908536.1 MarR family transcriptional regulator [Sulfobacillus thermotolerans]
MDQEKAESLFDGAFRVLRMMGRQFARDRAPWHITPTQYHTLYMIRDQGTLTLMDMAKHLQVSAPTATRAVDALAQKGLLSKDRDPQDRRMVWLRLSESGEALLTRERREHVEFLAQRADERLTPEEQDQLIGLLNKLIPPESMAKNR